jgi:hypothetical protein
MKYFTKIETEPLCELISSPVQKQADPPQPTTTGPSSLDKIDAQYQQAICSVLEHTRAGRMVEASRSLLKISEWLVTNARDLGRLSSSSLFDFSSKRYKLDWGAKLGKWDSCHTNRNQELALFLPQVYLALALLFKAIGTFHTCIIG